jgi:hypothetical protein
MRGIPASGVKKSSEFGFRAAFVTNAIFLQGSAEGGGDQIGEIEI